MNNDVHLGFCATCRGWTFHAVGTKHTDMYDYDSFGAHPTRCWCLSHGGPKKGKAK